jgi:hypothetical protein
MGGLQQAMADFKAKAKALRVEGTAGGGLVRVVVNGEFEVLECHLAASAMDDRELLEDLVRAATNEATRQAKAQLASSMGGMAGSLFPGLMF